VGGQEDVIFQGGEFPIRASNTIYNIVGAGTVFIDTSVAGSVIAPDANIFQRGGVVYGFVFALSGFFLQANLPECPPPGRCDCCVYC